MNLFTAEQLSKSYGVKMLFDQISFSMDEGDRVGLIGVNGTGKSTLLKVIAGIEPPDQGKVVMGSRVGIEYLHQNPPFDDNATVLAQIFHGTSPAMQLLREYEEVQFRIEQAAGQRTKELEERLFALHAKMDALNAWQLEIEAKKVLTQLGITEFTAKMGELSGGQRKRVALAGALIRPADLLIFDEPTNHLDSATVDWLEQVLTRRKTALLMITHDRYFLDRVANRMIELDQGKLFGYTGNYSRYLEQKAERLEQAHASERKRQNLLRNELAWIKRGAKARSTKQKARIERFEKLQEAKIELPGDELDISLSGKRLGKKVIELNNIGKSYAGRTLIRDFSHIVQKHDRIGIIGPNGSGKSTLLNMIAGQIAPDFGEVIIGPTVNIGFFSQENDKMDEHMRVLEYIKEAAEQIRTADGTTISASQMLERFLFPPAMQWSLIADLSGGEKRRLYLMRILAEAPNVLLLDEPTNDLDVQTLAIVEEYLESFPGAVIAVSHDRFFLDRVAETIFAFQGDGHIESHIGNYSEYDEARKQQATERTAGQDTEKADRSAVPADKASAQSARENKPLKFSFKEQKEFAEIDDRIAATEQELNTVTAEIDSAGSDYAKLQALTAKQQQLAAELDQLLERWTYLNELAEAIEQQKSATRHKSP